MQHLHLALGRGPAVRTHAGDEERLGSQGFQPAGDGFQHLGLIADSPAAGGQGNSLSRFHFAGQAELVEKGIHFLFHVRQPGGSNLLLNLEYTG
jgi:hypothetical protein